MSTQSTLKDFWTSSRKATTASVKLTDGHSPPFTGGNSLLTTSLGLRNHGRKRTATSTENTFPPRKRRAHGPNINFNMPSKLAVFRFLDLPYDLQHIIRSRYCNSRDLISLSWTCHALRLDCLDSYVVNEGVISQSFNNRAEINLHRNAPRLTVMILTSSLLNYYSWTDIAITIDLPHLINFQSLLYDFIRSIAGKITTFTLLFSRSEHYFLSNSSLPSSLIAILSYIGESCVTVNISSITTNWTIEGLNETQGNGLLQYDDIGNISLDPVPQQIAMGQLMSGVLFLKLDLCFFCTPRLCRILSFLVKGRSICELSAVCQTNKEYQALIAFLCCPALENLQVIVHDSFPILLSDQFIQNHTKLERLSLVNAPGPGNDRNHTPSAQSILHLPPLQEVSITANYSCWTMTDYSHITSLTIESLCLVVRPQNSHKYCESVRSLVGPIVSYRHPLPARFLLELKFPAELTKHINIPVSSKWQPQDCICSPCDSDEPATNIQSLRLRFDTVNRSIAVYLMRWLAWFPELRTLEIEHSDNEGVDVCFTSRELIGLRSKCAMLEYFQCTELWNEPVVWRYYSSGAGWVQA